MDRRSFPLPGATAKWQSAEHEKKGNTKIEAVTKREENTRSMTWETSGKPGRKNEGKSWEKKREKQKRQTKL